MNRNRLMRKLNIDWEDVRHYSRVMVVAGVVIVAVCSMLAACGYVVWDASQVPPR